MASDSFVGEHLVDSPYIEALKKIEELEKRITILEEENLRLQFLNEELQDYKWMYKELSH